MADATVSAILRILEAFSGIQVASIIWFESIKHLHGPYPIETLVNRVRNRLWGIAVFLLLAVFLLHVLQGLSNG